MKFVKSLALVLPLLAWCTVTAPQVRAETENELTYFTFNAAVEVPGRALPAGTYVFKLVNSYTNCCNIVQILSADQTKVYATVLVMPDYRREPTNGTVLTFAERPVNSPEAIESWFYPLTTYGHRFVYPKGARTKPAELKIRSTQNRENFR